MYVDIVISNTFNLNRHFFLFFLPFFFWNFIHKCGLAIDSELFFFYTFYNYHFDSKQSRGPVDLPLTCHPSPSFTTFAFRSSEVMRLLSDLDPYGGPNPLGMFPLFLKWTDVMAHRLSVVLRRLVRLGSFPACWRQVNVTTNSERSTVLFCCQLHQFP